MKRIIVKYNGREVEAILLACFKTVDSESNGKKGLFGIFKRSSAPAERQYCLVFIPWKHSEKEFAVVPADDVSSPADLAGEGIVTVDGYVSRFTEEAPYYAEYEIRDFVGYTFVCDDKSFIANVKNQCTAKPLAILYQACPELLSEETA